MAISPFRAAPSSPEGARRRARLTLAIATLGIVATLIAYALSPGVRHVVGHAAHSVKHAVSHVFDHDHKTPPAHAHRLHLVQPIHPVHAKLHKAPASPRHTPTPTAPSPSPSS